jgi:hypothetical protein
MEAWTPRVSPPSFLGAIIMKLLAALGMTWFITKEGAEAWRGEDCGCSATRADEGDDLAAPESQRIAASSARGTPKKGRAPD